MPRPIPTALLACILLAGCAGRDELGVERQWGDTMARLGMFGIYPPSEDVQVGDVYLHAPPRDSNLRNVARFSLVRMASLPATSPRRGLHEHLTEQQTEDRLRIQPLPAREGQAPTGVERQRAVARGQAATAGDYQVGHADEGAARVRLRRAALPGLTVGRVTEAALGGGGTSGNFGAALGFGRQSRSVVQITLSDVQDMAIDTWRLSRMLRDHETRLTDRVRVEDLLLYLTELRPDLLAAACAGNAARLAREEVSIIVIGRVLYAGGIDYSFDRSAETALRLAIDLQSTLARQPQAPQVPTLPTNPTRSAPTATEPAAAAGERLAGMFNALTGETGGAGRAGVTARLGIGTFGQLTLKTEFGRPIAVGAGGRINLDFFQAMRGDYAPRRDADDAALVEFRYRMARATCEANAPEALDVPALAAAFDIPAGRANGRLQDADTADLIARMRAAAREAVPPRAPGRGRPDRVDAVPAPIEAPIVAAPRARTFYVGPNQLRP